MKRWILVRPHESGIGPRCVWGRDGWQREAKASNSRRFLFGTKAGAEFTLRMMGSPRDVKIEEIWTFEGIG